MLLNLLTDIPREIRDKIYLYVLAASSGPDTLPLFPSTFRRPLTRANRCPYDSECIIARNEGNITMNLSILLTCKQIRRECKYLIWFHNGLLIPSYGGGELRRKFEHYLGFEQFQRIRCIVIRLELLDRDEMEWICQSLQPLIASAQKGNLQSIRLLARTDRSAPMAEFINLGNLSKDRHCVDGRWYRAAPLSGRLVQCQWKFVINTGWPRFSHEKKQKWIRELLVNEMETDGLLKELNCMFGGGLYVNGALFYEGGRRMLGRLAGWGPLDGEIEIRPRGRVGKQSVVVC